MTGGQDGSVLLDSTELYDTNVGSWVVAGAKLPIPMWGFKAVNIEDRVLIFGRNTFFSFKHPHI